MKSISFLIVACSVLMAGEGGLRVPRQMEGTEIVDKRGAVVPADVMLTDHTGKQVRVGDFLKSGRPLILTLGYYKCPMLCSLVLNGMTDAMKGQSLKLDKDYDILSVSINPNEKQDLASAKRQSYLGVIASGAKQSMTNNVWTFATGSQEQVRRLADSVGFGYKYDEQTKEYVHSAGIFILSPDGVLSRTLYGISFKPTDFKMSLIEASQGKIGSLLDRVILSCFHYQPDSHRYGVYIFGVMRLAGLITVVVLAIVLGIFWKRERRVRAWTA